MINKINFSEDFMRNIENISNSRYYSPPIKEIYEEMFEKIRNIKIFPQMYPKFNEKANERKIVIKKYIVTYIIKQDEIILTDIILQKSKKSNYSFLNNQD